MSDVIVQAVDLTKEFIRGQVKVTALEDVELAVARKEFVALMVLGEEPASMSERALARWRNHHIGFVFQSFNLIPVLTAQENVELPLKLTSLTRAQRREMSATALKLVGLDDRADHFPRQ